MSDNKIFPGTYFAYNKQLKCCYFVINSQLTILVWFDDMDVKLCNIRSALIDYKNKLSVKVYV